MYSFVLCDSEKVNIERLGICTAYVRSQRYSKKTFMSGTIGVMELRSCLRSQLSQNIAAEKSRVVI